MDTPRSGISINDLPINMFVGLYSLKYKHSSTIVLYLALLSGILSFYTRSPKQDSRSQDFRQGLGCSEVVFFIGSG